MRPAILKLTFHLDRSVGPIIWHFLVIAQYNHAGALAQGEPWAIASRPPAGAGSPILCDWNLLPRGAVSYWASRLFACQQHAPDHAHIMSMQSAEL